MKEEQVENITQWLTVILNNQKYIFDDSFLNVKVGPAVIEVREGFD